MTGRNLETSVMSSRYALALFELSEAESATDAVIADLDKIVALTNEDESFQNLVKSPVIAKDARLSAIRKIMEKSGAQDLTTRFMSVIAANERSFAILDIISAYKDRVSEARGEVDAFVTSAILLDESDQETLKNSLGESLGKTIKLNCTVDPSILGGLIVRVGSKMIDTSLRTKLDNLKLTMREVG